VSAQQQKPTKVARGPVKPAWSGWECQECGHRFRTVRAAERASMDGCPKCGGVDVDLSATAPLWWTL